MTEAEAQAKQLDSVTDHVAEQEMDSNKAQQAMNALSANQNNAALTDAEVLAANAIVKEDVELIMSELDVTEEIATRTLRQVAVECGITKREGDALVVAALKKLVTS
jgi:hypothetical protein